jgi:hypothetical protein
MSALIATCNFKSLQLLLNYVMDAILPLVRHHEPSHDRITEVVQDESITDEKMSLCAIAQESAAERNSKSYRICSQLYYLN